MSKIEVEQISKSGDNDTASTSSLDNTTENTKINEIMNQLITIEKKK